MPDVNKADTNSPYRVDGRATIFGPIKPQSIDVCDGVNVVIHSGIRVNKDVIYPSGT